MGSEWRETTVGKFCHFTYGKSLPARKRNESGSIPVYGSGGLSGHHDESMVSDAGIVIGRKGTVGSITYSNCPFWPIDTVFYVTNDSHRDLKFTYYLLKTLGLEHMNADSAVPGLNRDAAHGVVFRAPPLPEQKAIAHILGTLDDKIELNRRMNATLEGMAQALFKSWFVDFDPAIDNALAAGNPIPDELAPRAEVRRQALANGTAQQGSVDHPTLSDPKSLFPAAFQLTEELGWIPEGWEISSFGDVSNCFDRKRIPLSKKQREEKKPGAIPYYGATSIMDFIDDWIFDDTYLLIGEDGSVMKEDGSPFVQYIWGKTWVNNHAHVLQGDDGVSTEHLMLFMQAQDITPYVTGAVQLKINQKNMNSIPFLNAGSALSQRFSECITPFYERIKKLTEENETLTKLRDTLLPKLISGDLRAANQEQLTA